MSSKLKWSPDLLYLNCNQLRISDTASLSQCIVNLTWLANIYVCAERGSRLPAPAHLWGPAPNSQDVAAAVAIAGELIKRTHLPIYLCAGEGDQEKYCEGAETLFFWEMFVSNIGVSLNSTDAYSLITCIA